MLVTILTILMLQLQSFSQMFMVFLTAPLGLIGVVAALLVFQAPLGFVAILGITALCGMIMRNAVILVDQVQAEIAAGRDHLDRGRRSGRPPDPSGGADRGGHRARDDSADAQRVLGPDGDRDHGRPHRRDLADDLLRAGPLRGVVQGEASSCAGCAGNDGRACTGSLTRHMIATSSLSQARRIALARPRLPARRLRDESRVDADACAVHRTERETAVHRCVARVSAAPRSICCSSPIARPETAATRRIRRSARAHGVRLRDDRVRPRRTLTLGATTELGRFPPIPYELVATPDGNAPRTCASWQRTRRRNSACRMRSRGASLSRAARKSCCSCTAIA